MSSELAVIFQDVQYSTHLGEDQDPGSFGLHRFKQFVEDNHFAGVVDEVLVSGERWSRFLQVSPDGASVQMLAYSSIKHWNVSSFIMAVTADSR